MPLFPEDCIEWLGPFWSNGYGRKGSKGRVHRLEWERHYGPIPEDLIVMHVCDNRRCYFIGHLKLGTQKENIQDSVRKGKGRHQSVRAVGSRNHQWKGGISKNKKSEDKSICRRGHARNTYWSLDQNGKGRCKACRQLNYLKHRDGILKRALDKYHGH